jgi:hypothetical protein
MPAVEARTVAVQHPGDRAQGGPGQQRGSSGVLSARRNASACGGLNRACAWAGNISGSCPASQPDQHRRAPAAHGGRLPGRHFGAADRSLATPASGTAAAVIRAAGAARGARTGR